MRPFKVRTAASCVIDCTSICEDLLNGVVIVLVEECQLGEFVIKEFDPFDEYFFKDGFEGLVWSIIA